MSKWQAWMTRNKGDIYVFVDTRLSKQSENFFKSRWKGKIYFNSYSSNARRTAVFVRKNAYVKNCKYSIIDLGSFSTLHFDHDNKSFALNVLYGPNADSPLFYKKLYLNLI